MEHVPYKGLVQALQDVITGRLDVMFAVIGGALPMVQANKLKTIAVSGASRSAIIPNVPTFAEVGYPTFDASFYFAVAAPAGTPRDIINKFATRGKRRMQDQSYHLYLHLTVPRLRAKASGIWVVDPAPIQASSILGEDR